MTRSPVVVSGFIFTLLALFGYHIFGWRLDGWILCFGGAIHLAVVLRWYPRLDRFLVSFHYFVTLVALGGFVWILVDAGGTPRGAWVTFLSLLQSQWVKPSYYWFAIKYILVMQLVFFTVILGISWVTHRRKPERNELMVELFVVSLLTIPCELAIIDAIAGMGAFRPEESRAILFAFGIENLTLPVILHGIIASLVIVIAWRSRRDSLRHSKVPTSWR